MKNEKTKSDYDYIFDNNKSFKNVKLNDLQQDIDSKYDILIKGLEKNKTNKENILRKKKNDK